MGSTCPSQHQLSPCRFVIEIVPILLALEKGLETFPEIPSDFSLKLSMLLVLRIGFLTVDEPPFLNSLIPSVTWKKNRGLNAHF